MLSLNPIDMLLLAINLLVLYLFLRRFLWKPVTNMIESRQQEIEHNLAAAADQRAAAEALHEDYNLRLKDASHEAAALIARAKQHAESEAQGILKAASKKASHLVDETEQQLENERLRMLDGVRHEVVGLAILAAARVSAHERDPAADEALLEQFLSEAGDFS